MTAQAWLGLAAAALVALALAACSSSGGSNSSVSSGGHDAQWASDQLRSLQSSFTSDFNNKDWGSIYDLYVPGLDPTCPKSTFTIGIFAAVVSMGANELTRIIAAMEKPPIDGRLLSANDTVITWALTFSNSAAVSSAAATNVNGRWLFDGAGPCADFIG